MKLRSAFFAVFAAYLADAASVPGFGKPTSSVGAVYFSTNDPDGNSIAIANIGSDGNITYAGSVSTGGNGLHGNDGGAFGPDSTFSTHLVDVHQQRGLLAAANLQSNTIALFSINRNDPSQLKMIGDPVSSQGDFPSSVTFNQAGNVLCTANGGALANLACFDVTNTGLRPQTSNIRPIPNYNQTTPPTGPDHTTGAVAFTPDGKNLVVTVKGQISPSVPGFIAVWPLKNGVIGKTPTIVQNRAPGNLSFSLTPIPGHNAFISGDFESAIDIFDLDNISNANKSAGTSSLGLPGGLTICWSVYSPTLNRFYLTAPAQSAVVEVTVDHNLKPTVVSNYTIPGALITDVALATIGHKDFLYTLVPNGLGISVQSLNGPGNASLIVDANFTNALTSDRVAFRTNYAGGLSVFMKD